MLTLLILLKLQNSQKLLICPSSLSTSKSSKQIKFSCQVEYASRLLLNTCTQMDIRFLKAKYETLQLFPKDHSFSYSEIQNFTVAPKRLFIFFYTEIQNFENGYSFHERRFFDYQKRNFQYPNSHSFFGHEIQTLKLPSNGYSFFFWQQLTKIERNSFFNELLIIWKNKQNY